MINEDELPMPLGVRTALLDVKLSELEELGVVAPDRYYVLNFERAHSYGPIRMDFDNDGSNYYVGWSGYASGIRLDRDNFLMVQIAQQINWELIVCPMFAKTQGVFYGRYICNYLDCLSETFYGATVAYLSVNDPQALVNLGADYNLVWRLRNSLHSLEQEYINKMAEWYKNRLIPEDQATPWDKMWMAYFGFQFYNPPALPSEPATPSRGSSAIMLLPPFVYTNGGIGVKGSFVRMSVVGSDTVAISSTSSGTKPLSEMAKYNGDASIRGGTLFFSNQNHMQVISSALSSGWVYCSDAVVQAYKLLKVGKGDMFGVNLQSSPVGAVLSRSYLDGQGRMCIMNVNALSLLQLGSMSIQGGFQGPDIYIFSLPV